MENRSFGYIRMSSRD